MLWMPRCQLFLLPRTHMTLGAMSRSSWPCRKRGADGLIQPLLLPKVRRESLRLRGSLAVSAFPESKYLSNLPFVARPCTYAGCKGTGLCRNSQALSQSTCFPYQYVTPLGPCYAGRKAFRPPQLHLWNFPRLWGCSGDVVYRRLGHGSWHCDSWLSRQYT